MNQVVEFVGLAGAILTTICWLPQAVRILRTRNTYAISLPAHAALTTGILCWLIYGFALGNLPLILGNIITFALTFAILMMKLRYG
jgi:MtN3 and saliva related transmembrane protein